MGTQGLVGEHSASELHPSLNMRILFKEEEEFHMWPSLFSLLLRKSLAQLECWGHPSLW